MYNIIETTNSTKFVLKLDNYYDLVEGETTRITLIKSTNEKHLNKINHINLNIDEGDISKSLDYAFNELKKYVMDEVHPQKSVKEFYEDYIGSKLRIPEAPDYGDNPHALPVPELRNDYEKMYNDMVKDYVRLTGKYVEVLEMNTGVLAEKIDRK